MQIDKGHAVVVAVAPGACKLLVQFVDIGFFFLYIYCQSRKPCPSSAGHADLIVDNTDHHARTHNFDLL
jgi:hypothetical protein